MKRSLMVMKALLLAPSLLSLALPVNSLAGSVTVVSDTSWNVFECPHPRAWLEAARDCTNGGWLGLAQNVCLDRMNPPNCGVGATPAATLYGYARAAWTANLSSLPAGASWIWSPKTDSASKQVLTGASSPAAFQEFKFETEFYLCEPPKGGIISVAVDNAAEVWLNGNFVPDSTSTTESGLNTFKVPPSFLYGSSLLNVRPNKLTVKATNLPYADPSVCPTDQYQCNPAGVVLGATFQFQGDPTCAGFNGQPYSNGQRENLDFCPAGQVGSVFHICLCGDWTPNINGCVSPPSTCTGTGGTTFSVGGTETLPCPPGQIGSATRTCRADGSWGPTSSTCMPPPPTCTGTGGTTFSVGATETLSCPPSDPAQIGSATRTCRADGSWGPTSSTCNPPLPWCGDRTQGQVRTCPNGTTCVFWRSRDQHIESTVMSCRPPSNLGEPCLSNGACTSGFCDTGWPNTQNTHLCMPTRETGANNDPCTNDAQCAAPLVCASLTTGPDGSWIPGRCGAPSGLGQPCSNNGECASGYCDRGFNTGNTNQCMPRGGQGASGDPCSHNSQCMSGSCNNLTRDAAGHWIPGRCM